MTYPEFEAAVGRISLSLPDELFEKLNGGIIVSPETKLHKKSVPENPLYIAGEYTRSPSMRLITVYYGSFMRLYGHLDNAAIEERIDEVLRHELRHHWESLSGECGLEIEDADSIDDYLSEMR